MAQVAKAVAAGRHEAGGAKGGEGMATHHQSPPPPPRVEGYREGMGRRRSKVVRQAEEMGLRISASAILATPRHLQGRPAVHSTKFSIQASSGASRQIGNRKLSPPHVREPPHLSLPPINCPANNIFIFSIPRHQGDYRGQERAHRQRQVLPCHCLPFSLPLLTSFTPPPRLLSLPSSPPGWAETCHTLPEVGGMGQAGEATTIHHSHLPPHHFFMVFHFYHHFIYHRPSLPLLYYSFRHVDC